MPVENNYFISPLTGIVSSGFKSSVKHYGVDLIAPKDTPIKAVKDGHVILADWTMDTGYTLGIQHNNNLVTFYKHNSELMKKVGDVVKSGETIAIIGNTGLQTSGFHLHFELWYDSLYVIDPFEGPCGNVNSFWAQQDPYDTSFQIWRSGLIATLPVLDTLRFRKHDIRNRL